MLKKTRQKIRRIHHIHRLRKTGYIYHHHCWEIVVSKRELMVQLAESCHQDNLLRLLVFGKEQPDYEKLLLLVGLKFEFLGSLVYPISKTKTGKPPLEVYIRELFGCNYETLTEARERIERLTGMAVSDASAEQIFCKLLFVIYTCCPYMSDSDEIWWSGTYRCFLEYAVENDCFSYPDCQSPGSIWDAMPKEILTCSRTRDFVLTQIPQDLRSKSIKADQSVGIRR